MASRRNSPATDKSGAGAQPRGKRQKSVNAGALSALEKIKRGRESGVLQEGELDSPSALFDLVDDAVYGRIVQQRQQEAFVLDDDGSYTDHGREVFEEEEMPTKKVARKVRKREPSSSIKTMLMSRSAPSSRTKEEKHTLADDELLSQLLHEAEQTPAPKHKPSRMKSFTPRQRLQESGGACPLSEVSSQQPPPSPPPGLESREQPAEKSSDSSGHQEKEPQSEHAPDRQEGEPSFGECDWEHARSRLIESPAPTLEPAAAAAVVATGEARELLFYWLDAFEDSYHQPGTVFLFGKMQKGSEFVSCCVIVRNIERCLYLLPRETMLDAHGHSTDQPVTFEHLYNEFTEKYADPFKLPKFTSKRVSRRYAFELADVPAESEYLEVRYSAAFSAPPTTATGRSFSRLFGTTTSSLERLILKCGLKGPCWLRVNAAEPASVPISWCKHEVVAPSMASVVVETEQAPPPPIVTCSVSVLAVTHPKTATTQVLCIGCLLHTRVSLDGPPTSQDTFHQEFCVISHPVDRDYPFGFRQLLKQKGYVVEVVPSERALLAFFLAKLHKLDPDILLGHNMSSFLLELLLSRLVACKVPQWSRAGRLKRKEQPRRSRWAAQGLCAGRPLCDIKLCAMELIRARSYDLTELASAVLGVRHTPLKLEDVLGAFSCKEKLAQLVSAVMNDSLLTLRIFFELDMLPLAYQMTCIAGNTLSRTLLGGRAERNEFLLLHAFTAKGFICPDKLPASKRSLGNEEESAVRSVRHKPSYAGGLVLEPKRGFYDNYIILLDFNSLYPSIIQEYNICFTTVEHTKCSAEDYASLALPGASQPLGVLPTEIRVLVERRRKVKQLMKSAQPPLLQQYDTRQKALKLTANSMYGCLGFTNSRFYAKPLAALVTGKGREVLAHTKELAEKLNYEVIYGDTDSIMINSKSRSYHEAEQIAQHVKTEVNKFYRLLEIDMDGLYKCMLLLRKKKYAAVAVVRRGEGLVEQRELKGLDVVRRDWCNLAKNSGLFVLNQILSGAHIDDIISEVQSHLTRVQEDVKAGRVAPEQFVISKGLTKAPGDYPDKRGLPHVQVALRQLSRGMHVGAGDVVPYIICQGEGSQALKAFHPEEVTRQALQVDTQYYLQHQLHAVVSRLCEPIQGLDSAHIALWLGLDSSAYAEPQEHADGDTPAAADDFEQLPPLLLPCQACKQQLQPSEGVCPACGARPAAGWLANQILLAARAHIARYYAGWLVCEDRSCGFRSRGSSSALAGCPNCHHGRLTEEYPALLLYRQLASFDHQLGLKGGQQAVSGDLAAALLAQNHYSTINLASLFP